MKLTDLPNEFPEDKGDWVCWIEVRHYDIDHIDEDDFEDEEKLKAYKEEIEDYYDSWGEIPIVFVCKDWNDNLAWIKVLANDSFFKENEDFDRLRFFFINGSLNKGGYDEVEVKPVANFHNMVYFKPVEK